MNKRKCRQLDLRSLCHLHGRNKETFQDGWVRTGDEVIIRNGEVFVVDRIKAYIFTLYNSNARS
jgi:acyl-CoA synthetase (AMP-forming)/AMP-acid ligase II